MSAELRFLLSLSIIFAVIIGIVRYRKIDRSYYPFIYYVWFMLLVEIIAHIFLDNGLAHVMNTMFNVYTILEFSVLAWLFHAWGLFNGNRVFFYLHDVGIFHRLACRHRYSPYDYHRLQLLFPGIVFLLAGAFCRFDIQ